MCERQEEPVLWTRHSPGFANERSPRPDAVGSVSVGAIGEASDSRMQATRWNRVIVLAILVLGEKIKASKKTAGSEVFFNEMDKMILSTQ